jgi:nucleotide-binding universal stress UspA family protein
LDRLTPKNVLVAWKSTTEAQRALADAVPFMKRAGTVVVAAVHEGDRRPDSIDDAVTFLTHHGIAAKAEVIPAKGAAVEDVILDFAQRTKADLIVAGAYGHSRVREWIFGGVTRALIQKATVPFLLSH